MEEHERKIERIEEEGVKGVFKYFDRIQDRLFTLNNIMLGAYFILYKLDSSFDKWLFLLPISNMLFLLFIDYRMMNHFRFEAQFSSKPISSLKGHGKSISITTIFSLISVLSCLTVIGFFVYNLLRT